MLNSIKIKDREPLQVLSVIKSEEMLAIWKSVQSSWNDFFEINQDILKDNKELIKHSAKKIDIIFLEHQFLSTFDTNVFDMFIKKNKKLKLIVLKNKFEENDHRILKQLVNDIIYFDTSEKFVKWKTIAELRRYWDTHAKTDTIIYKSIIINFNKNELHANGKVNKLTLKENQLLKYFYENKGIWLDRSDIFKTVWEYDNDSTDYTRTLDQMIFKLKKKIGADYFKTKRLGGIKFE